MQTNESSQTFSVCKVIMWHKKCFKMSHSSILYVAPVLRFLQKRSQKKCHLCIKLSLSANFRHFMLVVGLHALESILLKFFLVMLVPKSILWVLWLRFCGHFCILGCSNDKWVCTLVTKARLLFEFREMLVNFPKRFLLLIGDYKS